MTWIDTE
ncbi:mCG1032909 [Mus musculus]|nr:mCG1032909 [Mus musculus]